MGIMEQQHYNEEYRRYLERYEMMGEGRPKLSPEEYDRLDDEILDLLALEAETGKLPPQQEERYQELVYLLIAE